MTLHDLRQLSDTVQPIRAGGQVAAGGADVHDYNAAVFAFRELLTRARNTIVLGNAVEPALEEELRASAAALAARGQGGATLGQASQP
jgi:hypothetical protein